MPGNSITGRIMHRGYQDFVLPCIMASMLAFFLCIRVFNDGAPGWKHIVTSDGRGYYAYLPAFLLDGDPTFSKVVMRESRLLGYSHYKPSYLVKSGEDTLNKYFAGEALLLLPFFLAGLLLSWITGTGTDGYSFFFQFFTGLGALFYLTLGLLFLKRILEHLRITAFGVMIVLPAILFGTNLFYYSLWQPTMSHHFSFFAINGFMWCTIRATREWRLKTALLAGLFLGLVCLIRPVNIVTILLIPFLAEGEQGIRPFLQAIRQNMRALFLAFLVFVLVVFIQPLLWSIQTGRFLVWPYAGEGFNFGHPEIAGALFGFRKGFFVYTPLTFVALLGLVPLWLRGRIRFLSMILFLAASVYLVSSWWNWYYGDGFGLRAFIDYYGVFAILFALLADYFPPKTRPAAAILVLAPLLLLNLVQTWQYTHGVIHPNSMNGDKYRYIFMRTDSAVIGSLGGSREMADHSIDLARPVIQFHHDFEMSSEDWNQNMIVISRNAYSGSHAGYLDSIYPYSPGLAVRAGRFLRPGGSCFLVGELMVRDSIPGASNSALVVLSMDSIRGKENWWQGFKMNDIPVTDGKGWRKISFSLMLPEMDNPDGILKVYIWNTGKKPMLIDDFSIRIYGRKRL